MADTREEQAFARAITHRIAVDHGFTVADLTGRDRTRPVVAVRQEAMAAVYSQTALSTTEVGKLFGGRDHTTVLNGIRRHEQRSGAALAPVGPVQTVTVVSKQCSRCGETKPAAEFHRHNRRTGDGLQGYCRGCANEDKRDRRGTRRRRRHGADVRQTSMQMDRQVYAALLRTAEEFGVTRSELIEGAVRRELRRLWSTCRRCEQAARVAGTEMCGRCLSAETAAVS